jgi:hypothetical protein
MVYSVTELEQPLAVIGQPDSAKVVGSGLLFSPNVESLSISVELAERIIIVVVRADYPHDISLTRYATLVALSISDV